MTDPVSAIIESSGLLPPGECLRCEVCCRFPSAASPLAPYFSHAEMEQAVAAGMPGDAFPPGRYGPGFSARLAVEGPSVFRCPAFRPATNDCAAYAARPLDCRLYPFMLLYDADGKEVFLGLDTYCPAFAQATAGKPADAERAGVPGVRDATDKLSSLLDGALLEKVIASRGIVGAWNDHVRRLRPLPALTRALCRTDLGLARLVPTARERLLPFFDANRGAHSFHAFAPIYVWSDIFDLHYKISGERLLVFAEGDGDCFLICPPLGTGDALRPAEDALATMRELAPRGTSPRIQDADDGTARQLAALSTVERAGWRIRETHVEYLYPRAQLADLRGNRYEKKRQLCNRFEHDVKDRRWRPFAENDLPQAMALYSHWLKERTAAHPGEVYAAQAEASWRALYRALRDAEALQLVARALEANGQLAGFTLGCPLHDGRTFHVMFEVSDLAIKGAAQFMFRELCRELQSFERINAGSASGLDNLARVKESYRPTERLPSHTLVPSQNCE
jgi:Fe-S-cluster containining protein